MKKVCVCKRLLEYFIGCGRKPSQESFINDSWEMFYANSVRYYLSSREGKVSSLIPFSVQQYNNIKNKKYFAKLLFTQKQMMGRKKLAPLTPLLLCVANID